MERKSKLLCGSLIFLPAFSGWLFHLCIVHIFSNPFVMIIEVRKRVALPHRNRIYACIFKRQNGALTWNNTDKLRSTLKSNASHRFTTVLLHTFVEVLVWKIHNVYSSDFIPFSALWEFSFFSLPVARIDKTLDFMWLRKMYTTFWGKSHPHLTSLLCEPRKKHIFVWSFSSSSSRRWEKTRLKVCWGLKIYVSGFLFTMKKIMSRDD